MQETKWYTNQSHIYDNPNWVGYDIVLDVWPDVSALESVVTEGHKTRASAGPAVVCQHGRDGVPSQTIDESFSFSIEWEIPYFDALL